MYVHTYMYVCVRVCVYIDGCVFSGVLVTWAHTHIYAYASTDKRGVHWDDVSHTERRAR